MELFTVIQDFTLRNSVGTKKTFLKHSIFKPEYIDGYKILEYTRDRKVRYLEAIHRIKKVDSVTDLITALLTRDRCTTQE